MWPKHPYQTQRQYLCDEHTGRPLCYRDVICPTGEYFPSKQQTDTFCRAGLDPVDPDWEQLRGILVAEGIPAEQVEQLTIPAIVGLLGRLYPPQPPVSEKPAVAEPQANDSGQAESQAVSEPLLEGKDLYIKLYHRNEELKDQGKDNDTERLDTIHNECQKQGYSYKRNTVSAYIGRGRKLVAPPP